MKLIEFFTPVKVLFGHKRSYPKRELCFIEFFQEKNCKNRKNFQKTPLDFEVFCAVETRIEQNTKNRCK